MSLINDIAHNYDGVCDTDFSEASESTLSVMLEDSLTNICNELAKAHQLLHNKSIDIEYLLTIVGSYLMGIQQGTLDKDTEPPSKIFELSLYPTLANMSDEIITEVIEEDEDDDGNDNEDSEGYAPEDTPDLRA